ncbi:MAG: tetraacyldisaccharide 4'-kinase [Porticoccaceae bacterium]|nr:tetraacyldisaccharide 4'-kinase [Porticoccaceae bacterium]
MSLEQFITAAWARNSRWLLLLVPLTWLFAGLSSLRRRYLQRRYQGQPYAAPVVIVGNISVGGSGKTPLIIALVSALKQRGYSPGVVSRGYSGNAAHYPLSVTAATAVSESGDEPLLIATLADCPVVIDANRSAAVDTLLKQHNCDLVLSDDGLQHYALHRDIELIVVDGQRGLGNGRQLPSGPLREKPRRLEQADLVVINGPQANQSLAVSGLQQMSIRPTQFRHLQSGRRLAIEDWLESEAGTNREVHAVAAIGNPQRFADTLSQIGLGPILHRFDDHRTLSLEDLVFADNLPVIVTAKDAIKLEQVADVSENIWALDIEAVIDSSFVDKLVVKLEALKTPS